MSEQDKIQADQYRFGGYDLPMLQLDETGPAYYYIARPHPYYFNQPLYWIKSTGSPDITVQEASNYGSVGSVGAGPIENPSIQGVPADSPPEPFKTTATQSQQKSTIFPMADFVARG